MPVFDTHVISSELQLADDALAGRGSRHGREGEYTSTGLWLGTALPNDFSRLQQGVTHLTPSRSAKGVIHGNDSIPQEGAIVELGEDVRKKQEKEAANAPRKTEREAKRLVAAQAMVEDGNASEGGGSIGWAGAGGGKVLAPRMGVGG